MTITTVKNILTVSANIPEKKIPKETSSHLRSSADRYLHHAVNIRIIRTKGGIKKAVAEMDSWEEKSKLMKNRTSLKIRDNVPIYVEDDLTPEDRKVQWRARRIQKSYRETGQITKMGYKKVIINNEVYQYRMDDDGFVNKESKKLEEVFYEDEKQPLKKI